MNIRDLEEVNFWYRLHSEEFCRGMAAAGQMNTIEYKESMKRMRLISLRFKRAKEGYYSKLRA